MFEVQVNRPAGREPGGTSGNRGMVVDFLPPDGDRLWDDYVLRHPRATVYHLCGWRRVIGQAYKHEAYYLTARAGDGPAGGVVGILPLFLLKHFLLGTRLVSIPFLDCGGALTDEPEIANLMTQHAVDLGRQLGARVIELRHRRPLPTGFRQEHFPDGPARIIRSHKVGMELELPSSAGELWHSFKAKLRSQIRKPMKEKLTVQTGGMELLAPFYEVFARNMRDLGSPVHSRKLPEAVLRVFAKRSAIIMIFKDKLPVAGGLVVGDDRVLANPWSSALRRYSGLSPNMLLYWTMLEFACQRGYAVFDFGRSTPGGGTYRFKQQWGAKEKPLTWEYIHLQAGKNGVKPDSRRLQAAVRYWQKMPVPWSRVLGPLIRKHIDL